MGALTDAFDGAVKDAGYSPTSASPVSSNDESNSSGLSASFDSAVKMASNQSSSPSQSSAANKLKGNPKAAMDEVTAAINKGVDFSNPMHAIVDAAGKTVYDTGSTIVSGWKALAALATGGSLDDAANTFHEDQAYRAGAVPELSKNAKGAEKLLQLPGMVVGKVADAAGDKTLDATGSPALAAGISSAINIAPMLLMKEKTPTGKTTANVPIKEIAQTGPSVAAPTINYDVPTYLRNKMAANQEPVVAEQASTQPINSLADIANQKAAAIQPKKTGMLAALEKPVADTDVSTVSQDRANKIAILQRIGLDKVYESALNGDQLQGASEAQMTKFNEPAGQAAKEQFSTQNTALKNHAESIVNETGGSLGTDNSTLYARGNAILEPLDSLKEWFDTNTKKLYDEAAQKAQGQSVALDGVNEALGKKSNFSGNTDTLQLRSGVTDRMQELGMLDKDGNVISSTVDQAENLRKYLNEQWTPKNSKTIGMLKDAIDNDVMKASGEDIYQKARAMRAMRGVTLDDPNGISKIIDASGPNGINRAVATEKIPDAITGMPVDQLAHVIKTLKTVPAELQGSAQASLNEIKAQFANKIMDAGNGASGQWNAKAVAKYLKNNAERMSQVFSKEEIAKIQDLHDAGNILDVDKNYPGAAAQASNALKSGLMVRSLGRAGALIGAGAGSLVGLPGIGAYAGDVIGNKAALSLGEGKAVKNLNKGITKISDFPK